MYNAGEALTVPAGVIHAVRNVGTGTGTGTGTALATDVVEKGKPLLTWPVCGGASRPPPGRPGRPSQTGRRACSHRQSRTWLPTGANPALSFTPCTRRDRLVMIEKYESERARAEHAKGAALAGLRSALEGKLSSGLDAQVRVPDPAGNAQKGTL